MSAVITVTETAEHAAHRLAALREGDKLEALHVYADASGRPIYSRMRVRKADGHKRIRPMHWNGARYVIGEPAMTDIAKPLYRLRELSIANTDTPVLIVEGEWCVDHA